MEEEGRQRGRISEGTTVRKWGEGRIREIGDKNGMKRKEKKLLKRGRKG